jgi:rhamnose utilization protein RhaD (predicted bifunctional aldolase and dehydrogenase)
LTQNIVSSGLIWVILTQQSTILRNCELNILQTITALSHEFGTSDYVRGGGGNTSCKDEHTLWVKPSGTTLAALTPEVFVAIDRKKLSQLYDHEPPADSSGREVFVKQVMEQAVLPQTPGRASVEAPLHDSLKARYVVHTHPAVVNGMTCAKEGKAVCRELFSFALWLDYIDPGYTLCMQVRKEVQNYKDHNGKEPNVIFLKNHGVFVAADTPEDIRALYADIMARLKAQYQNVELSLGLNIGFTPGGSELEFAEKMIRDALGNPQLCIAPGGFFDFAPGPISPDHIVYSKSYPFIGEPTIEGIADFKREHGYLPQVIVFNSAVFGVAENERGAQLALELAQDGAIVKKLAGAFGGIDYMTDRAREFIENWEVESYRKKQM